MIPWWAGRITSVISSVTYSDAPNLPLLRGAFNPSIEMKEALTNTSLPLTEHSAVQPLLMVCTVCAKAGRSEPIEVQGELDSHIPLKKRKTCTLLCVWACVCLRLCVREREQVHSQ